jgi:mannose-6-phosphate isomerase class I
MPSLEPFLVERILMPKVWGGQALAQVMGIQLPPGEAIGETWELYDRAEGSSRLRHSARTHTRVSNMLSSISRTK